MNPALKELALSKKIEFSKKDLKNPDAVLANLKQGFEWSAAHSKAVLTFLALFIFIGGAWGIYSMVRQQTDEKLQENFYFAEKNYLELRKKFEDAQNPKVDETKKTKAKDKNAKVPPVVIKPSANPDVDYAEPIKKFRELAEASPSSKAGLLAALYLSDIYRQSDKLEQAVQALDPVTKNGKPAGLLGALAIKTKGNLQADLNKCPEAIETWQKLNQTSESLAFLTADVKLKMALCHEKMNQPDQAEAIYREIIDRVKNPSQQVNKTQTTANDQLISREAEKFLRLLKIKKDQRGS